MKIINYSEIPESRFNSETVQGVAGRVVIGSEDGAKNFCMRVFELDKGGFTPRHEHDWEHEIFFHGGNGEVWQNGRWVAVSSGSVAFIPGKEEHQIKNTGKEKLIFVCLVPSGAPEL